MLQRARLTQAVVGASSITLLALVPLLVSVLGAEDADPQGPVLLPRWVEVVLGVLAGAVFFSLLVLAVYALIAVSARAGDRFARARAARR